MMFGYNLNAMFPMIDSRILIALIFVVVILKGFALWHSARNRQKIWFIAVLVLNTLGILPLIYLLFFNRIKVKQTVRAIQTTAGKRKIAKIKPVKKKIVKRKSKKKKRR